MDAWHDCFYNLAKASTALSLVAGDIVMIDVAGYEAWKVRRPEMARALLKGPLS